MSKRLTVLTELNNHSGYGQMGCQIILKLVERGYDVSVRALNRKQEYGVQVPVEVASRLVSRVQSEPWELIIASPIHMPTPGKKTAYYTMWEVPRLKPDSVQHLNHTEVVINPTQWGAACFSARGVNTPIRVVPMGVDPEVFIYDAPKLNRECVFGTAGWAAGGGARKGISEVVEAFQRAFPMERDVILKVKALADQTEYPMDARIQVEKEYLKETDLVKWYQSLTAFVSASRGEGWGLIQHQVMACGRPVIGCNYGGMSAYLREWNSYPLQFDFQPAEGFYGGLGNWVVPKFESLVEKMREVYEHREIAFERGVKAHQAAVKLSWDHCADKLAIVIEEFGMTQ